MSRNINEISSSQNKTFKRYKSLQLRKYREKEKCFLLEGQRYVDTALLEGAKIQALLFDVNTWEALTEIRRSYYLNETEIFVMKDSLLKELSQTEHSQGVIAVAEMIKSMDSPFLGDVLMLDRIQDPGNLGTIIRTADAAGIKDILLLKGTVDAYNAKVVRSTAGSILNVVIHEIEDAAVKIDALKALGYKLVVTALEDAYSYDAPNCYHALNCLVIGNEANGVSSDIFKAADIRVKIPIYGKAESLNAAVATGIMLYKIKEAKLK